MTKNLKLCLSKEDLSQLSDPLQDKLQCQFIESVHERTCKYILKIITFPYELSHGVLEVAFQQNPFWLILLSFYGQDI